MQVELDRPDLFSFDDSFASLGFLERRDPALMARVRASYEENREFCQTYVRPLALSTDLALQRDPSALATELLQLAIEHKRFSRLVPGILGGAADGTLITPMITAEETASVDAGFVGVLSGHGLGMAALGYSMNLRLLDWFAQETIRGEREGKPFLIDCAITEPNAGSDVEETALLPHASLVSEARRVPGGAILNARKCFISGGHFASHHLLILPFDRKRPVETAAMFVVPSRAEGFSLGKLEHKMGMKAGPASELILEDCFVPEEHIAVDAQRLGRDALEALLFGVLGTTRIYVGAWATGIARGAFETALQFAKTTKHRGKALIQHQLAQRALVDMLMNVHKARSVYLEAMFALMDASGGAGAPGFTGSAWFQAFFQSYPVRKVRHSERLRRVLMQRAKLDEGTSQRVQFYSSLAKVACSDLAMENCHRALELMGAVGVRHGAGAEKMFRDAKLCQIFEGTNQLNRLHMMQHFIARGDARMGVF